MAVSVTRADRDTDPDVADIAGLEPSNGDMLYWASGGTRYNTTPSQSFGRGLLNKASAAAVIAGLSLYTIHMAAYGVDPNNSAAANYTAIEAGIDAMEALTGTYSRVEAIWPSGIIYTTGGHVLNKSYQTHRGGGGINRVTTVATTSANVLFTLGDGTTLTNDYAFKSMGFSTIAGGTGIWVRYVQNVFIDDFYETCDRFLCIGDSTATGGAYRVHLINGEGIQVASSTLLSHVRHEWNLGEYKRINVNIEGRRQTTTIGEDFSANKNGGTIDGVEFRGGYNGRFEYNVKQGSTRLTNLVVDGVNFEGAGTTAWDLNTSSSTGGLGNAKIVNNNFGTDAADGSWAASPSNPVRIYINHSSVSMDTVLFDNNLFTSEGTKTCFYMEVAAGLADCVRVGAMTFRGVMADTSQYISHIKGGSGSATITNFSHGSVVAKSFTNALAGGIKYEGAIEASEPDAGKVPSTVTYFIDDSHTVPLRQGFRLTIVNTAGTMQHKVTGLGDDSSAGKSELISRFTGFSTSLQNTPTATDSSTAMVGGGKISSSDPSRFILDTIATQTTNLGRPRVQVVGNTTGTAVFFKAGYLNSSVNGVTLNRPIVTMYRPSDGTAWGINTTNIAAGQQVVLDIEMMAL